MMFNIFFYHICLKIRRTSQLLLFGVNLILHGFIRRRLVVISTTHIYYRNITVSLGICGYTLQWLCRIVMGSAHHIYATKAMSIKCIFILAEHTYNFYLKCAWCTLPTAVCATVDDSFHVSSSRLSGPGNDGLSLYILFWPQPSNTDTCIINDYMFYHKWLFITAGVSNVSQANIKHLNKGHLMAQIWYKANEIKMAGLANNGNHISRRPGCLVWRSMFDNGLKYSIFSGCSVILNYNFNSKCSEIYTCL
jgi:hypothetical protein